MNNQQNHIDQLTDFIRQTFAGQHKTQAVIAVSGGIDSAVALALLARALGSEKITAVLLPYGDQSVEDSLLICQHVGLTDSQIRQINIAPMVDSAAKTLAIPATENLRLGNVKARARMMCVYDLAKARDALVCGTENKSEHYLGYFTRFGDAASDIEPISTLYKTQVRQLAEELQLPALFLEKPPSAGLWVGQTDEVEMGFTYEQADQVLELLVDLKTSPAEIKIPEISSEIIAKIIHQVEVTDFKRQVPYEVR